MENENGQTKELEERIGKAWQEVVAMEERLKAIPGQVDGFTQKLTDLEKAIETKKEQLSKIESHYSDYFSKPDAATKSKHEVVTEHHANVDKFLKAATELKDDLDEFRDFVMGNESLKKVGFKKELEDLFEKNKTTNEKLQTEWSNTYKTLYDKIEGLLPGATSTGLSKAYQDQKQNYRLPVIVWSSVFGVTITCMIAFGLYFYTEVKTLDDSLRLILARLPFFIPAIWLAIFASKQQSQYKRLQQEYIYKETLAKSFESYKREIDQLPEGEEQTELQHKLISAMVEMCGYNPSLTLEHKSHEEKPPIPGTSLLNWPKRKKQVTDTDAK